MTHQPRIAVFIDGANLYAASKAIGVDIDYAAMLRFLKSRGQLVRAFYYTALLDQDQEFSPLRPLIDWLDYNGYTMVTKPAKEFTDQMGRRKIKGNMDIEIAVDMMEIADKVDEVYLFSGDGDFRRLIESVQRNGCRVTVFGALKSNPPMVADELRRQADEFADLADPVVHNHFKKQPKENHNEKLTFDPSRVGTTDGVRYDQNRQPYSTGGTAR